MLQCVSDGVCVSVCMHANTYQRGEGGGSFGSVSICSDPHLSLILAALLLPPHLYPCSPRAEDKQRSALNSQWLLSIFFISLPSSSKLLLWKITERCFASHGKKKKKYNIKD